MMRDFRQSRNSTGGRSRDGGGYSSRGGGRSFGGRDRRDRGSGPTEMFSAICDECGNECQVPFQPTGERPVYCSNCFERRGEGNRRESRSSYGGGSYGRRDSYNDNRSSRRSSFGEKRMFSAICDKCGNECEVPFKPSGEKPVYCSDCFEETGGNNRSGGNNNAELQAQLDEINSKLDKIMREIGVTKVVRIPASDVEVSDVEYVGELGETENSTVENAGSDKDESPLSSDVGGEVTEESLEIPVVTEESDTFVAEPKKKAKKKKTVSKK